MLISIDRDFGLAFDAVRVVFHDKLVHAGIFWLHVVDDQAAFSVLGDRLLVLSTVHEWHVAEVPIVLRELSVDKRGKLER